MNKKIPVAIMILGITFLSFLIGWNFQNISFSKVISANGTIEYIPLEGGFYGIVTDEGEKYLPLNLPEGFKKDGLRIWFKAKPKKVATNQMWGKPIEILEIKLIEVQDLSQIKVAVQYRYVTDGEVINRSLNEVIKILKETKADFIFQGWMTQEPCPDKCSDYQSLQEREKCNLFGYSYEHLKEAISKIKKELPDIIFCGGTQAEYLYPEEASKSHLILEPGDRDKAWEMALNPEKWEINVSKKDFQCYWAKRWGDIDENEPCPSEEELKQRMKKYFPDLTNPDFQKIFLERIYKQIDAGVDAIWIDMLYVQARLMEELTKDPSHPAVKESYEAAFEIVEKIHQYGKKKGKYIYVITWVAVKGKDSIISVPKEYVNVDAAMVSPSPDEIKDKFTGEVGNFNEKLWDELVMKIKEDYGIPIFARIDYGGPGRTQLYVFSQELSKEEAREFLRKADEFFSKKGIIFIYPVHGGDMGRKELVEKLSYGKFNWYDSLAPEFETYETIKELAQKKTIQDNLTKKLLSTRVACWYQTITDYKAFNRTLDNVITHLKETNTDFIFRAFWKYKVIPETCSKLPPNQKRVCEKTGYSYEDFKKSINEIKKEIPSIIISAGIPTERIDVNEYNPITGKKYTKKELWEMALDPAKWNITNPRTGKLLTKEEFQFNRGKLLGFFPSDWTSPSDYDWREAYAYYPDITNPEFQKLQLSWAKKMIDSGADAIWIDMLFAQARIFYELTKNPYHSAVKEAYEAALKQIDEIHKYAKNKGKYVYVGGWTNFLEIKDSKGSPAYPMPDFDFVVNMIWEDEVKNKNLSEERWDAFFAKIRKYLGNDILILVFMDEAAVRWQDQPLGIFSQYLNKTEQAKFLEMADSFFSRKREEFKLPITFVYPLHGGWMGTNAEVLSFGKFKVYDSLAPEFETYETIKNLAQKKVEKITTIPEEAKQKAKKDLSKVRVASWYQTIADYKAFNRTLDNVTTHLKEMETDFVFRAFWRWNIIPDTSVLYPKVENVVEIRDMLREEYGDQIVFCRIDGLIAAVKEYNSTYEPVEGKLSNLSSGNYSLNNIFPL